MKRSAIFIGLIALISASVAHKISLRNTRELGMNLLQTRIVKHFFCFSQALYIKRSLKTTIYYRYRLYSIIINSKYT